ncbi:MAG: transcription elongation factor GreA, partial [Clostridiales bacterium]|nr:transcription elongation factor GreA [Clostridiales bacterium]
MQDNLTQSDIDKMEAEIEYRKLTLRPKLIEDVKIARAQGDLSENFEYYAAKREKNMNESRIRYLDRMVRTANIIDDSSADDEVGINNTVTVEIVDEGEIEQYKIVTTIRSNSLIGYISIESPMGKALMGH